MYAQTNLTVDAHVGRRLALLREEKGLSREDLAALLKISVDRVRRHERGTNRATVDFMFRLSSRLSVPVSYFFEEMPVAEIVSLRER